MKMKLFDGKDGALKQDIKIHLGSVYAAAWSPDSKQIVCCSADKSVKVFSCSDTGELAEVSKVDFGKTTEFMQVRLLGGSDLAPCTVPCRPPDLPPRLSRAPPHTMLGSTVLLHMRSANRHRAPAGWMRMVIGGPAELQPRRAAIHPQRWENHGDAIR